MVSELINANPTVYEKKERRVRSAPSDDADEYAVEPIDQPEVFDILSLELFFFGFQLGILLYSHLKVVFLQDGTGFWELGLDWRRRFLLLSSCFALFFTFFLGLLVPYGISLQSLWAVLGGLCQAGWLSCPIVGASLLLVVPLEVSGPREDGRGV
jgi:hypothetical protein